jgi:hypothetical protein
VGKHVGTDEYSEDGSIAITSASWRDALTASGRFVLGQKRSPSQTAKSDPDAINWTTQLTGLNCGRWISPLRVVTKTIPQRAMQLRQESLGKGNEM